MLIVECRVKCWQVDLDGQRSEPVCFREYNQARYHFPEGVAVCYEDCSITDKFQTRVGVTLTNQLFPNNVHLIFLHLKLKASQWVTDKIH